MRKKGIPKVLVRSVMSLYEGAKTEWILSCQMSLRLKLGCTKDLLSVGSGRKFCH